MVDLVAEDAGAGCMPYAGDLTNLRKDFQMNRNIEPGGGSTHEAEIDAYEETIECRGKSQSY
jgi:hypothetical protein